MIADVIKVAANMPFADTLKQLMRERDISQTELCRRMYGVDERGKTRNTGKVSTLLQGKSRPQEVTMAKLAECLGMELEALRTLRAKSEMESPALLTLEAPTPKTKKPKKPGYYPDQRAPLPPPPPPQAPDQFALIVSQTGRATLRLNMIDVPMQDAMRAMAALTSAGILQTGEPS
jgi:transcriptional regulator with XRE-family HTH domain